MSNTDERKPDLAKTSTPEPPQDTSLDDRILDIIEVHYLSAADGSRYTEREMAKKSQTYRLLKQLLSEERAKLFEQIGSEVIGNNTQGVIRTGGIHDWKTEDVQNKLRNKQREALEKIERNTCTTDTA